MRWSILAGAALLALGCGKSVSTRATEAEDRARYQQVLEESRELRAQVDEVEARLYTARAEVGFWSEMAARHGQVSEVACQNAQMHAESMDLLHQRDRDRMKSRRVAQAGKVMSDVRVSGYRPRVPAAAP